MTEKKKKVIATSELTVFLLSIESRFLTRGVENLSRKKKLDKLGLSHSAYRFDERFRPCIPLPPPPISNHSTKGLHAKFKHPSSPASTTPRMFFPSTWHAPL